MLHIHIDANSGVPAYRQVMDQIKQYVAAGTLSEGEPLPSIRELAGGLSVNPSTVVKAYSELKHEGVIGMRRGKGAFVREADRGLTRKARREALRPLLRRVAIEALQLGVSDEDVMLLMREASEKLSNERRKHEGRN